MMSRQPSPSPFNPTITDPFQYLQIVPNPDGTITRDPNRYPNSPPTTDSNDPTRVLSKDISVNRANNTWVRIFLPPKSMLPQTCNKLPLIVYFHGGGFIYCSAASTVFHDFCSNMAVDLLAIIVSVDYRLAPEHRLPAAYDDAMEVLRWIKAVQLDWLKEYADFTQCYIMGSSAGANIAYNTSIRASDDHHDQGVDDYLEPLMIRGLILHHPFIGGTQRTASEIRLVNEPHLPQCVSDLMWKLALPIGVDRDHEYCNPMGNQGGLGSGLIGWRVLVTGCDGDPMIDRQMELAQMLMAKGVEVVSHFTRGGYHVVELREPSKAKELYDLVNNFIASSASGKEK